MPEETAILPRLRSTGREPDAASPVHDERLEGGRILVTGATGFIGAHLVDRLLGLGCRVAILMRPSSDATRIAPLLGRVDVIRGDVAELEPAELAQRVAGVDIVFHLAAGGVNPAVPDNAATVRANTVGTLKLLELAHAAGVKRFVYCGSCFEYAPGANLREDQLPAPTTEYGASKAAAWMLAHAFSRRYGLPVVSLRPFTVYGPLEAPHRLIPYVIRCALAGDDIELTGGDQARDFVYVDDVIDSFVRAGVIHAAVGGTFNVCTGKPATVREVVSTVLELTGSSSTPRFGSLPYRETEPTTLSGATRAAREILGWTAATSLRAGLERTVRWTRTAARDEAVRTGG